MYPEYVETGFFPDFADGGGQKIFVKFNEAPGKAPLSGGVTAFGPFAEEDPVSVGNQDDHAGCRVAVANPGAAWTFLVRRRSVGSGEGSSTDRIVTVRLSSLCAISVVSGKDLPGLQAAPFRNFRLSTAFSTKDTKKHEEN